MFNRCHSDGSTAISSATSKYVTARERTSRNEEPNKEMRSRVGTLLVPSYYFKTCSINYFAVFLYLNTKYRNIWRNCFIFMLKNWWYNFLHFATMESVWFINNIIIFIVPARKQALWCPFFWLRLIDFPLKDRGDAAYEERDWMEKFFTLRQSQHLDFDVLSCKVRFPICTLTWRVNNCLPPRKKYK